MTLETECAYLYELRAAAIAKLEASNMRAQAKRLRELPPLTERGAPVKWLTAHESCARHADLLRLFDVGTTCMMMAGALCALLDDLIQWHLPPAAKPTVDLTEVLRASVEANERKKGAA